MSDDKETTGGGAPRMRNLLFKMSDDVLGIPYHRDSEDRTSHSFVDLKHEPELLDEIPEARDEPALRELLLAINDGDGLFKSVGCARWYNDADEAKGMGQYGSYVGFFIDAWPFIDNRASIEVAESFDRYGSGLEWPDTAKMMFEVRPTMLYATDSSGWSLDFWAWGFGFNRDEAHASWRLILDRFCRFIANESGRWREFIKANPDPWPDEGLDGPRPIPAH